MGNLQGGTERDRFILSGGTLSGTVDGNGGDNVVEGNTTNSLTWTLTGTDAGTVIGIASGFTNIANLKGGDAGNTFIFDINGSLSGNIDGGLAPSLNTLQIANTKQYHFPQWADAIKYWLVHDRPNWQLIHFFEC
ncbi:hypothetical protein A6770_12065 [Nostoc minutum NIES-26]|uniref:Peptidase M10 serralysin C-terminal domain-containing protein n=1 Tax=Nostoc minutum NIES-26 TaxID=1844469 RepID=A0A367RTI9_9NOSO|nr:hypothetical protein A6770_12065 [Nostoc minutum NIES-26]